MFRHLCCAALLSLILAGALFGQLADPGAATAPTTGPATNPTTRPGDLPEIKPIRESAKAFIGVLFGDDVNALQAQFAGTKEDFEPVRALHGSFDATRRLGAAMEKKFPLKAGEKSKFSLEGAAAYVQENIDDFMEVTVTGDTADGGDFKFRKLDGTWRVIDFGGTDKTDMVTFAARTTKIMNAELANLVQGKYKTREEAEAAVMKQTVGPGRD